MLLARIIILSMIESTVATSIVGVISIDVCLCCDWAHERLRDSTFKAQDGQFHRGDLGMAVNLSEPLFIYIEPHYYVTKS